MNNDQEVQLVFNKVINAGLYDPFTKFDERSKNYMCNSLKVAASRSVISFHDYTVAKNAIRQYLKSSLETMYTFLKKHEFPSAEEDRLAIYKDWADRPQPKE